MAITNDYSSKDYSSLSLLNTVQRAQHRWKYKKTLQQLKNLNHSNKMIQNCMDRLYVTSLPDDQLINSLFEGSIDFLVETNDRNGIKQVLHSLIYHRIRHDKICSCHGAFPSCYANEITGEILESRLETLLYELLEDDNIDLKYIKTIANSIFEKCKTINAIPAKSSTYNHTKKPLLYLDSPPKSTLDNSSSISKREILDGLIGLPSRPSYSSLDKNKDKGLYISSEKVTISHGGPLLSIKNFLRGLRTDTTIFVSNTSRRRDYAYARGTAAFFLLDTPAIMVAEVKEREIFVTEKSYEALISRSDILKDGLPRLFNLNIRKLEHDKKFTEIQLIPDMLKSLNYITNDLGVPSELNDKIYKKFDLSVIDSQQSSVPFYMGVMAPKNIIALLKANICEYVRKELTKKLISSIETLEDLYYVKDLLYRDYVSKDILIANLQDKMPGMVSKKNDFISLAFILNTEQLIVLCEQLKPKVKDIIKDKSDLKHLEKAMGNKYIVVIFETWKEESELLNEYYERLKPKLLQIQQTSKVLSHLRDHGENTKDDDSHSSIATNLRV